MLDVTVVGGGWSVQNVLVDRLCGTVIAVNDSAVYLPHWDHALSMDRLWTEHRLAAVTLRAMENSPHGTIWLRRSAVQNFKTLSHLVRVFDCDHETNAFAAHGDHLNGTHSGACALNLAYQLRPTRLFLLGFDFCRSKDGRAYWYPPYPWTAPRGATSNGKYESWALQLAPAQAAFARLGCAVYNVSPHSALDLWPKWTPARYLKECR